MSKKQVLALWIIAIALVIAVVVVKSTKSESFTAATDRSRGDTLLADFKPDEVAAITITKGKETLNLKKTEGAWTVAERDNYPALVRSINELLRTLADVKVTQGIEADPASAPRFGMDPESENADEQGTDLVLADASGKEIAKLTFGKNLEAASDPTSPFGGGSTGRFVRNHADTTGIYVTSEVFPTLSPKAEAWLHDEFLKVEKIQSITVSEPGKPDATAWKLTRPTADAEFALEGKADNEELNAEAITPLKSLFSYARFEDVLTKDKADAAWNKEQRQTAVITTEEGFTYNLSFGPMQNAPAPDPNAPAAESYLMTVTVTANIPAERKKEEGEKEEDAKTKDEAFAKRKKELEDRLAADRKLEGRTYKVSKYTIEALLKKRPELIKAAQPAADATPAPAGGPAGVPENLRRPVQAVTPPIEIPAAPEGE
ncbi:MAG: DUF4340 domain-containing protein [Akkermansiaceae bacterium]|jgi:hypothetical protein|nr:DUF4340 domain-containing protein [Akkermansiaceae bacterium]